MIGVGFKCDRIVVESAENGVKVSCVMISVGDYEMWDGNVMGVGNEMNGVEIVSDVVYERVFDGVEIMKELLGFVLIHPEKEDFVFGMHLDDGLDIE